MWQTPPRSRRFVGRDLQLDNVHDALGVSRWVAVHATGTGMGRRQLAVEYVHRFRADYDLMWWVPAMTRHHAARSLAKLARRLERTAAHDTEAAAQHALSALKADTPYSRWLLIYDDASSPEKLTGLLPSGSGRVLLTVRDTTWEERMPLLSYAPNSDRAEAMRQVTGGATR